MSFKRTRSLSKALTTSKSPSAPQNGSHQRTTRLSSRVSELDSRVTIFGPGATVSVGNELGDSEKRQQDIAGVTKSDDDDDNESPTKRTRKRIKLDSSDQTRIVDIEDLAPSTRSSPQKDTKSNFTPEEDLKSKIQTTKRPPSKSKSPSKAKPVPQSLEKPHPAPPRWRETYDTIKSMRSRFIAPVDTMGCAQAQTGETEPRNRRYATLVSLMLSSQTKDEVTYAAIANLRAAFGGSISLEAMIEADEQVVADAISKVGFWRKKTSYLKQVAIKLRDEFDSDVPNTADELCSLPGVGPKMAFLTLQIAWGLNLGIGVDVHVHRITNILGWHKPPTKTPEQTRLNLQSWLPKELHYEINEAFVGFGQVICLPVNPRCDICDVNSKGLCPSASKVVKSSKGRKDIVWISQDVVGVEGDVGPKVEIVTEEEEQKVLEAS